MRILWLAPNKRNGKRRSTVRRAEWNREAGARTGPTQLAGHQAYRAAMASTEIVRRGDIIVTAPRRRDQVIANKAGSPRHQMIHMIACSNAASAPVVGIAPGLEVRIFNPSSRAEPLWSSYGYRVNAAVRVTVCGMLKKVGTL